MPEELCEFIVKVQRNKDRVMAMVMVFKEEVIGAYWPHFVWKWHVSSNYQTTVKLF